MSIFEEVRSEQIKARKNGDKLRSKLLTTLIGEADPFGRGEVSDEQITQKLNKFRKNILESIDAYTERGVDATELEIEKSILEEFLPKEMGESEMKDWIEFNLNPDSSIREAMVGINKYAKENGLMVDKGAFAKLVNNR